jgi:hypothetical protein
MLRASARWQKWIKFFHPWNSSGLAQVQVPVTNLKGGAVPLSVKSMSLMAMLQFAKAVGGGLLSF